MNHNQREATNGVDFFQLDLEDSFSFKNQNSGFMKPCGEQLNHKTNILLTRSGNQFRNHESEFDAFKTYDFIKFGLSFRISYEHIVHIRTFSEIPLSH